MRAHKAATAAKRKRKRKKEKKKRKKDLGNGRNEGCIARVPSRYSRKEKKKKEPG